RHRGGPENHYRTPRGGEPVNPPPAHRRGPSESCRQFSMRASTAARSFQIVRNCFRDARLAKEDPVALESDLGIIAPERRYRAIPAAGEAAPIRVLRRDIERRLVFDEVTAKAVRLIIDGETPRHTAPLNGAAYGCLGRGTQ